MQAISGMSPGTLGIVCVIAGMACFSLQDVFIKLLSDRFPLHEIVFARSLVAVSLTLVFAHFAGGIGNLKSKHPYINIARALLLVVMNLLYYCALASLPIADAAAIFFIAPILILALSIPVLGEKVGPWRWLAIALGSTGVLIMLKPGGISFNWLLLLPLGAAFCYACTQILTRRIGLADKASTTAMYVQVSFFLLASLFGLIAGDGKFSGAAHPSVEFLLRAWSWPGAYDAALMAGCGLLVATGGYLLSQAYRVAAASAVAPYEYSALALAVFWGVVIWSDCPDIGTTIGIALIVGSGLLIFYREKIRREPNAARRPMPRHR